MATASGYGKWAARGVHIQTWAGLQTTVSVGSALRGAAILPTKTVEVYGTFSSKGHVRIQGRAASGGTWVTLNDPQGNALDITSAKAKAILENPLDIRPILVSGTATASLVVVITSQSPKR